MNWTDGGKNRVSMQHIGTLGCVSVLKMYGMWSDDMNLTKAREILWKWNLVTDQMTRIEKLCYDRGVLLLYQSKAHPQFNATEVINY